MVSLHFDKFAKQFALLRDRREGLRLLVAVLAAGAAGATFAQDAAACKNRGRPCTDHNQCCSDHCKDRRKHGRGRKAVGKCDCTRFLERCKASSDCCAEGHVCAPNDCEDGSVCCKPPGADCGDDCDCCFDNICNEDTLKCEPKLCSETQDECASPEECCFEEDDCARIDPSCDPPGELQCCVPAGGECEDDCDCCTPSQCVFPDEDEEEVGECANPICLPDKIPCPAGSFKPCCEPEFGECCPAGSAAGCCQSGFPVCCDHENPPGIACCPANAKCCEPGDKQLCCPENQVCCPAGSAVPCANSLGACDGD